MVKILVSLAFKKNKFSRVLTKMVQSKSQAKKLFAGLEDQEKFKRNLNLRYVDLAR